MRLAHVRLIPKMVQSGHYFGQIECGHRSSANVREEVLFNALKLLLPVGRGEVTRFFVEPFPGDKLEGTRFFFLLTLRLVTPALFLFVGVDALSKQSAGLVADFSGGFEAMSG